MEKPRSSNEPESRVTRVPFGRFQRGCVRKKTERSLFSGWKLKCLGGPIPDGIGGRAGAVGFGSVNPVPGFEGLQPVPALQRTAGDYEISKGNELGIGETRGHTKNTS